MPTPTKSELWDQLTKAAKIPDQLYKFGATNTPNFLTMADNLVQALEGDHTVDAENAIKSFRSGINSTFLGGSSLLLPIIRQLAQIGYSVNITGLSDSQIMDKIYDGMIGATETIKARDITFGSVSAGGGNASTGNIYRTTKDKNNNNIEATYIGVTKFETITDKNSGVQSGNEILRVYGSGVTFRDEIDIGTATDESSNISFLRADNGILRNPSFDQINDNITDAEQPGWSLSDITKFTKITQASASPDLFRYSPGQERQTAPRGAALKFTGNANITQYSARENLNFRKDVPYFLICRWMRKSSSDGTLTLRLGSQTVTVAVNSGTNDVWNDLVLGSGTRLGWYEYFKEDYSLTSLNPDLKLGCRIQVDLSSWTTGSVVIDEIILAPAIQFNGIYYLPASGGTTGDSLLGDTWTFTDSASETGRTQYMLFRLFGKYLPHTTGAPTYADA